MLSDEQKKQNMIDRVMSRFDFDKVRKYMEEVNWTWCGVGVPSVDLLKDTSEMLLKALLPQEALLQQYGMKNFI